MKKLLGVALISLLLNLSPAGLTEAKTAPPPVDRSPLKITFIGGSPSGSWYMVLNGVSMCITKSYPGSNVTVVPGAGAANIPRINKNGGDCSLAHSAFAVWALKGYEPYNEKLENIAAVASLYPSQLQIVVSKKLGVKSFEDIIKRKLKLRIAIEQAGSAASFTFLRLLDTYGVTQKDFEKWGGKIVYKSMGEAAGMFADGLIDGYSMLTLYPASQFQESAANKDVVMLSLNPKVIKKMCTEYGYSPGTIPAKTYSFTPRKIDTVSAYTIILVPKNSRDEVPFKIARSIHENLDYLRSVHSSLQPLTPQDLPRNTGIALHPGAVKYYKEVGILKGK